MLGLQLSPFLVCPLVLCGLLSFSVHQASACSLPQIEPVLIQACAPDPILEDGRRIKVAGIAASQPLPCQTGAAMLSVLTDQPDRWGRLEGFFLPAGQNDAATNQTLTFLRNGYGLAKPGLWPTGCWALALAAEREARLAGLGVWSGDHAPVVQAALIDRLRAWEGRMVIVEGRVVSVRRGQQRVFINFGPWGPDRLSVSIPLRVAARFEAQGLALSELRGEQIAVRGVVGPGPSMEINEVEALAVLDRR